MESNLRTAERLLWLTTVATGIACAAQDPPRFRLGDAAEPRRYEVAIAADPREAQFTGEIRIELEFKRPAQVLWLNATGLTIDSAQFRQGERAIAATVLAGGDDFVGFQAAGEPFAAGPATASIRYRGPLDAASARGIYRQSERGEWYVLTQFEAISARRAFPCFDEPGWKTPWQVTIDAPPGERVVSNTPELDTVRGTPSRSGWTRHVFAPTRPLPTYLVAFAIGPFDIVDGGTAGAHKVKLRYITPKGRGGEARFAREATPRVIELLEKYFGIPYPFEKLDSLAVPLNADGAMENAGLITYGAARLLARPHEETDEQKRRYVSLAAHEIAHHWFGNYVTTAWWEDIWLNEAFATWMAEKVLYQYDPRWDNGLNHSWFRRTAIESDRLASARRIRNAVDSKDDISAAFDHITYNKGAEVLAMFEAWLGPDRFRDGVRAFLARHAWGSATSADFFDAVGAASGRQGDAMLAFRTFVEQPGVPMISAALDCASGAPVLQLAQERFRPKGSSAGPMQWMIPACFRYPAASGLQTRCVEIGAEPMRGAIGATSCPAWVAGNAGGRGYHVVRYDHGLAKRLVAGFASLPVPEAVAALDDVRVLSVAGILDADEALDWADAALRHRAAAVSYQAVQLLDAQRDAWLSAPQAKRKHDIVARRAVPLARRVGWRARPGEPADTARLRAVLLPFAARSEPGRTLRAEARTLAFAWLRDRASIAGDMAPPVVDTAARFADDATFAALESALATLEERDRRVVLRAIARARDDALRRRAFELTLAKQADADRLTGLQAYSLFVAGLEDEESRAPAVAFIRANFDALAAKLPRNAATRLIEKMDGLCTRADRDAFAEFFASRAARFEGATITYKQSLEAMDLCLAAHAT